MRRGIAAWIALAACGGSGDGDGAPANIDAPGGVDEPAELTGMTLFHNEVRAQVDTSGLPGGALPALTWDPALAATAAAWVARCQDTDRNGLVDHNPDRSDGHPWYVGENIFASTGTATARAAVSSWAEEQASYHAATDTCDPGEVCGHYTQLVWRTTEKVGCARHTCPGLRYASTIVCDYGPGGNDGGRPY